MNYFACKKLEYLLFQNAEINGNGEIVPKSGYDWESLFSTEKIKFTEKGKKDGDDIFYEQNLTASIKYDNASELQNRNDQYFILRLTKQNGDIFIWGTIAEKNPVQLEMDNEGGISTHTFSRKSAIPEI